MNEVILRLGTRYITLPKLVTTITITGRNLIKKEEYVRGFCFSYIITRSLVLLLAFITPSLILDFDTDGF